MQTYTITARRSDTPVSVFSIDAETEQDAFDAADLRFFRATGREASEIIIQQIDEAR